MIDALVKRAVFEPDPSRRDEARLAIRKAAAALGILPASIHDLYAAMGRGEAGGFTTPAMNLRMLTYDAARAVFRAAKKRDAGAFVLEIARSEMGYTDQRPGEYAAVVLGAAIREGHAGPVFIQGDHFQMNAKKYAANADAERHAIEALIEEAIPAGFLNIDIDTSTLVDMSQPTEALQQRQNFENAARFTRFIRAKEPKGITISDRRRDRRGGQGRLDSRGVPRVHGRISFRAAGRHDRRLEDLHQHGNLPRRRRRSRTGPSRRSQIALRRDAGHLDAGPRGVRALRRRPARGVDGRPRQLPPVPRARRVRGPSRDGVPEHDVRRAARRRCAGRCTPG